MHALMLVSVQHQISAERCDVNMCYHDDMYFVHHLPGPLVPVMVVHQSEMYSNIYSIINGTLTEEEVHNPRLPRKHPEYATPRVPKIVLVHLYIFLDQTPLYNVG